MRNNILIAIFIFCFAHSSVAAFNNSPTARKLAAYSNRSQYFELIRTYEGLSAAEKQDPEVIYLAGFAYMRLFRPQQAKVLLQKAVAGGFSGYPGWISAQTILERIRKIEYSCPPYFKTDYDGQSQIIAFSRSDAWTGQVLAALPSFLRRAKTVFGENVIATSLFLFEQRPVYDDFYQAMFEHTASSAWQNGTGNYNIVVFCEHDRNGQPVFRSGSERAIGDVLHEYGHSLCSTVFGDNYLKVVPQWFNEGTADAIAEPYYKNLFHYYNEKLSAAANTAPPSYEDMRKNLYSGDSTVHYAFAAMMVQELVKQKGITIIKDIVEKARQLQNFEEAIRQVSGVEPQEIYRRVLQKYWRNA